MPPLGGDLWIHVCGWLPLLTAVRLRGAGRALRDQVDAHLRLQRAEEIWRWTPAPALREFQFHAAGKDWCARAFWSTARMPEDCSQLRDQDSWWARVAAAVASAAKHTSVQFEPGAVLRSASTVAGPTAVRRELRGFVGDSCIRCVARRDRATPMHRVTDKLRFFADVVARHDQGSELAVREGCGSDRTGGICLSLRLPGLLQGKLLCFLWARAERVR
eukprot:TRINITY_DN17148_c0_g1_i1.p1 TRINITY_DN17148_c0_g1~~TRINITY_DN17148_c0_g1_i1.p1  ORF type:complete len:246 (+),score=66.06 TRINITY_DN17148_c0_g1_i1:87-740(+)